MTEPRRTLLTAVLLTVASLALFWPGFAMYDTVAQYGQVISGAYDDWHPPAMARLWSLFAGAGLRGPVPMLVLQLALYWLGLALIAAASPGRVAVVVLAIGAWPLFLGWQGVVLKDGQMAGALLAATGIVAWWRLRERALPRPAVAGAAILIGYAIMVRANAVFAAVPLAVLLVPAIRSPVGRAALAAAGAFAVLVLLSPINHALLGARSSGVERTQAIYDLAGIAVRLPPGAAHTGLTQDEAVQLAERGCVRPFFWDPLGEPARCDAIVERLRRAAVGQLYATLADAILHHPVAYAGHRLAHLNSTERWLVPRLWPGAAPPLASEANGEGLVSPGRLASWWQRVAGWLAETPFGWPIVWVAIGLVALAVALVRAAGAPRDLALALLGSALSLEASFAVLSIASDLRYHLWPMIATALATALLLGEGRLPRRLTTIGGAAVALVVAAGLFTRIVLPLPPQTYVGMLG